MENKSRGNFTVDKNCSFSVEGIHYASGRPVRVIVVDGFISGIDDLIPATDPIDLPYIAPGLIDNQVNGYANIDFSGDNLDSSGLLIAANAIWKEGVTSFIPTLITGSHEHLKRNFGILGKALDESELLRLSVPGFHLEGPYISPIEGFRGCHPSGFIRKPSEDELKEYQDASGKRIIQVTVAPEAKGAMEFIHYCHSTGLIVAMGHTNASASEVHMAADAGVRLSTHLGNGCANMIHRHHNPLWPQLDDDRLIPTIIADGHHLLPEEIRVFLRVKGHRNIILTSDVTYLAGMPAGKYSFLGAEVLLTEDGMLLNEEQNCLAGASFPLKRGVEKMMEFTGCSLEESIDMASANVARVYGFSDRGELLPGRRADMILFEVNDGRIKIEKTLIMGNPVFER
jgi:N-acetylglucosamine-6-phosphate deacetylase